MAASEDGGATGHLFEKADGKAGRNFKVAVRVRPKVEREAPCLTCVEVNSKSSITITKTPDVKGASSERPSTSTKSVHSFVYDRVFDENTTQRELYESSVHPVVLSVLEGYNGSVIAYGQTGTGKTHTIEGELAGEEQGIIPRAASQVFEYLAAVADTNSRWLVRVSYLQIYNEKISDLLEAGKDNLRIRENADGGVFVEGLSEHVVRSADDILRLVQCGKAQRTTNSTRMNKESSRSHAVFSVVIEHSQARADGRAVTVGKLHLVDLAGSERFDSVEEEKHQKETQSINTSLSAFGKVVLALTSASQLHTPYRDSKLTRILQDSLGGNCRTTMISTISPASVSYLESVNTLKFANRAKSVKNVAVVNEDKTQKAMLSSYQAEIERLRRQLRDKERESTQTDLADRQRLEQEHRQARLEKTVIVTELAKRQMEVEAAMQEKNTMEHRIRELETMLISGGRRVEETEEFQEAIERERLRLQQEQQSQLSEIEKERQRLQAEKEAFERERTQFMKRASMSALPEAALPAPAPAAPKQAAAPGGTPLVPTPPPGARPGGPVPIAAHLARKFGRSVSRTSVASADEAARRASADPAADTPGSPSSPGGQGALSPGPSQGALSPVSPYPPGSSPAVPRSASRDGIGPSPPSMPRPADPASAMSRPPGAMRRSSSASLGPSPGPPISPTPPPHSAGYPAPGHSSGMGHPPGMGQPASAPPLQRRTSWQQGGISDDSDDDSRPPTRGVSRISVDEGRPANRSTSARSDYDRPVSAPREAQDAEAAALQAYVAALTHPETGIPLGSRRVRLTTYRNCFAGTDGARWFMDNMEGVTSLEHAEIVGNNLMDLGVIVTLRGDKRFIASDQQLYGFRQRQSATTRPDSAISRRRLASAKSASRMSIGSSFSLANSDSPNEDGFDEDLSDAVGANDLHIAASRGDLNGIKNLLKSLDVDCPDSTGRTPLMYAALANQGKAVRMLLKCGAGLAAVEDGGNTALLLAIGRGHIDTVKVLVKAGADIDAADAEARTALHWATKCAHPGMLEFLLGQAYRTLVNQRDAESLTALHWAVIANAPEHVRLLLGSQADPALGDGDQRTPLHYSVSRNALECLRVLLRLRPDTVNMADSSGRTSLHVACAEGSAEAVAMLLAVPSVMVACVDQRLTTPLHWASMCNRADVCRLLLQAGAPLMARDAAGMTAMHYAHKKGHIECVALMQRLIVATQPDPHRSSMA
eukprot:m.137765 g.137765  ORF g.137765 m.137765 type:complete len:1223 (-) comp9581_c0_seq3:2173-5841(-)